MADEPLRALDVLLGRAVLDGAGVGAAARRLRPGPRRVAAVGLAMRAAHSWSGSGVALLLLVTGTAVAPAVVRGALLGLLCWVLTEGEPPGWYYGVVADAAALVLSLWLSPPAVPGGCYISRAGHTVRLVLWFLVHSVLGGIDVSRRIVARRMDAVPEVQRHPLLLEPAHQRQVALAMVSLMPGTLMVSMEEDTALIHVLDSRIPVAKNWDALQRRIAAAAGATLQEGGSRR